MITLSQNRVREEIRRTLTKHEICEIYLGAHPSITFNIGAIALVQVYRGQALQVRAAVFEESGTIEYQYPLGNFVSAEWARRHYRWDN